MCKSMKKKFLSGILALSMLIGMGAPVPQTAYAADTTTPKEIVLEKSIQGNPIAGFNENGDITYAGDPAILVDGDTVYLYVGHDYTGSGGGYTMPNYLCYSTQDLKEWKYEGVTMEMTSVSWADNSSAWASQVIKYQGKYWLLYCAERTSGGKAIAAAVSDSPTGPFTDQGILVNPEQTDVPSYYGANASTLWHGTKSSFGWEDIDPTAWIDVDEKGEEHVYMAWGNTNPWMCELEFVDGKVSVKDQNGDGKITQGEDADLWFQVIGGMSVDSGGVDYTEAPYLYRRQDENGNYYGQYYMFFATHWREEMGYATTDDIRSNYWTDQGVIMEPTATSNTNHPAVFDFKGHTYFIYHNGSLPGGSGYRRVICIEELTFNEDGTINYIQETSTGLTGIKSQILDSNNVPLAHASFNNPVKDVSNETAYPTTNINVSADSTADKNDAIWEIEEGKADKNNEAYVTIESYNKPGMYLTVDSSYNVTLAREHNNNAAASSDGITKDSKNMTFRTLEGFAGTGVTFESVAYPGYYLTSVDGKLTVSQNPEASACTFEVAKAANVASVTAQKTTRSYEVGEKIKDSDIRVKVTYDDGTTKTISSGFTTNAASIDTKTAGSKKLTVSYKEKGIVNTCNVTINIQAKATITDTDIGAVKDVPKKNSTYTVKNLKYKVTKSDAYNTDGTNGTVAVTGTKSSKLTSVTIPATVKIDGYTFKVTSIASKAFYKQSKLKTITIGDNVKTIGKNAISGINKKATIKVSSSRYNAVKKLLTSKTGYKKTMKIKKTK